MSILKTKLPPEWQFLPIDQMGEVILSNVDKKITAGQKQVRLCNYTDVYYNDYIDGELPFSKGTAAGSEIKRFALKKGDVIITKDSDEADDIAVPSLVTEDLPEVLCGYHLAIIRPNRKVVLGEYLDKLFQLHAVGHYFYKRANGITRFGLSYDAIAKGVLPIPGNVDEQEGISEKLNEWSLKNNAVKNLIEKKKLFKKLLAQTLLTGRRRFPGFKDKWRDQLLGDCFEEREEINNPHLPLLSITRDRGVIYFDDSVRKNSSSEDKSKYKRIAPGDIGYNTMRMWQGVSALSAYEGIVSPAYTVCVPNKEMDARFAAHLFKFPPVIHLFHRHSQGLVSDTLNLKFPHFAKIHVRIPSCPEQCAIANVFDSLDGEIKILSALLDKYKTQKRGLMDKLLTGKIRVKCGGQR